MLFDVCYLFLLHTPNLPNLNMVAVWKWNMLNFFPLPPLKSVSTYIPNRSQQDCRQTKTAFLSTGVSECEDTSAFFGGHYKSLLCVKSRQWAGPHGVEFNVCPVSACLSENRPKKGNRTRNMSDQAIRQEASYFEVTPKAVVPCCITQINSTKTCWGLSVFCL